MTIYCCRLDFDGHQASRSGWFSFEYFPPKTPEGVENLRKRIVKMKAIQLQAATFFKILIQGCVLKFSQF